MKNLFTFWFSLLAISLATWTNAQILKPVSWTFSVEKVDDEHVDLVYTATIGNGWHVYSQFLPGDDGPLPTTFTPTPSAKYVLVDVKARESGVEEEYDPNFDMVLKYFSHKGVFKQRIKRLVAEPFEVLGELEFMVCNDETCLPPTYVDTKFKVPAGKAATVVGGSEEEPVVVTDQETSTSLGEIELVDTLRQPEENAQSDVPVGGNEADGEASGAGRSLWAIFILSFLGGFAALLTPCVFPMIPLTVSFFTKRSKTRAQGISNAIIYALAIIILYVGIGFGITKVFGPDSLNAFSTHPWVNLVFFVILVVFAISFFGAFEITLPSSWVNKADKASERGGLVGIFFMAFTLALVSFSCTGPIIGTLLFEAFSGGISGPLVGMFGFSLALSLPFALFAAFPGWMNSLPKSGGWLNSVKVVLGFVELAFAFKFLSTADLVWQAHILPREHFLAIWISIFLLITMYLLGVFRMPHDSPSDKVSVPRLFFAILSLWFTVYLIPGLWGAPLKMISGFPPPMFYSESPNGFGAAPTAAILGEVPEGADPEHCPHNLNCFHDYEAGLAYAKKVNKPIMLDFTGWGCVNCRKMEEQVWSDPRVLNQLRNDVVLISLYVDERQELPKDQQYYSEVLGSKVRNVGNKWSEFQAKNFKTNSQPYYVFVGHDDLKPLHESAAYDPNVDKFVDWLERGKAIFEKGKQ